MPHPKLGKIGWFLGGGGCLFGPHQAYDISECFKEFPPDIILAESVGGYNSIDPENAFIIWKKYFFYASKIYGVDPELYKKLIAPLFEFIPRLPKWHNYKNAKELYYDCKLQLYHLAQIILLPLRLIQTISKLITQKNGGASTIEKFLASSTLRETLNLAHERGLDNLQALFDITPLISTIEEITDHEKALNPSFNRIILASQGEEIHFFARYPEPLLSEKYLPNFHIIATWEELEFALRATSALPPFFPGVKQGGLIYSDPGSLNPFPVEYLFDAGCKTVFAFVKDSASPMPERNIYERTLAEIEKPSRQNFKTLRKRAEIRAKLEGKNLYIITQQPPHPDLHLLAISPAAIDYAGQVEKEAMQNFFKTLQL